MRLINSFGMSVSISGECLLFGRSILHIKVDRLVNCVPKPVCNFNPFYNIELNEINKSSITIRLIPINKLSADFRRRFVECEFLFQLLFISLSLGL